jgi:hypothetical protein
VSLQIVGVPNPSEIIVGVDRTIGGGRHDDGGPIPAPGHLVVSTTGLSKLMNNGHDRTDVVDKVTNVVGVDVVQAVNHESTFGDRTRGAGSGERALADAGSGALTVSVSRTKKRSGNNHVCGSWVSLPHRQLTTNVEHWGVGNKTSDVVQCLPSRDNSRHVGHRVVGVIDPRNPLERGISEACTCENLVKFIVRHRNGRYLRRGPSPG